MGADAVTTDTELLALGLRKFQVEAEVKFIAGIQEHNPDGDRHLCRLEPLKIVQQMKQEAIDQWFYCCALEQKLNAAPQKRQTEND